MKVRVTRISQDWRGEWKRKYTFLFNWYDNYTFKSELIRVNNRDLI